MTNMRVAVAALFYSAAVSSAFSPISISRSTTTTQLDARQNDTLEQVANVGKAVTTAALSFALIFGSSQGALADGKDRQL